MTKGGRNLVVLGLASTVIALATTSVSLAIYKNSGDIYLDRSRPGFLPDDAEIKAEDPEADYVFLNTGEIDAEVLGGYVEALEIEIKAIDEYSEAFSADALSDKALGIISQ